MRENVIPYFLQAPGLSTEKKAYLKEVGKIYVTDAWHSLSIEKYKVTPELIEKVRRGTWNPKTNQQDQKQRNAMAARGYWGAFHAVVRSPARILNGENPGKAADQDHGSGIANYLVQV